MSDPDSATEWFADEVVFDYLGGRHMGSGLLRWTPEDGFTLKAKLSRVPVMLGRSIGLGRVGPVPGQDYRMLRMRLRGGARAVTLPVPLVDRFDVFLAGELSLAFPAAVLFESLHEQTLKSQWHGTGLLHTARRLDLPRIVRRKTWLGSRWVEQGSGWEGFEIHEARSLRLAGYMVGEHRLRIDWSLPASSRNRVRAWRLPFAVRSALAALCGQDLGLGWLQLVRGFRRRTEYRLCHRVRTLGAFAPFYDRRLEEDDLRQLVVAFVNSPKVEWISSHMCQQMFAAFSQTTVAATELLMATILEAALRTWEDRPFVQGDKYDVRTGLKRFRESCLGRAWKPACNRTIEAWVRLRNRNAHPDWLTRPGGGLSPDEAGEAGNDMLFLSRFYGYMILAMAGFTDLKPEFPAGFGSAQPQIATP
jgi:hypothetical protein